MIGPILELENGPYNYATARFYYLLMLRLKCSVKKIS